MGEPAQKSSNPPAEPKPETLLQKSPWIAVFFFLCFGWVTYESFRLAQPFFPGFLGAVILGLIFEPLYRRLDQKIKNPNLTAIILTLGILVITLIPVIWIGQMAVTETENLRPVLKNLIENYEVPPSIQVLLKPAFGFFDGFHIDLKSLLLEKMEHLGTQMNSLGAQIAKNVLITLFNAIILMASLFFVFRDGRSFTIMLLSAVPIDPIDKRSIAENVYGTFRAVVSGVFVTAFIGGLADMIGFILAGLPLPIFFGLASAFLFLFGASFMITIPAALWVMNHDVGWGIFLLIWGIVISAVGDNLLKPVLMGNRARMPFLLMLFSTIGGLKLYGFIGMFLGPMVVTAFLSFWSIYRKDYET